MTMRTKASTSKSSSGRSTSKRTASTRTGSSRSSHKRTSTTPPSRRWSAKVDTDTTHPDHGLFLKSGPEIARALASKRVSPKGMASGMRMLNFYINRAGKNLSSERMHELDRAKELLSKRIAREKANGASSATQSRSTAKTASARGTTSRSSSRSRSTAGHSTSRRTSSSK